MSALTQTSVLFAANPERIDSPSKFAVYSNATEVLLSAWDVRVTFMESVPPAKGLPQVIVHGSIVMAPGHAKAFLNALAQTVALYESKFGEIDLQKVMDAQNVMITEATKKA